MTVYHIINITTRELIDSFQTSLGATLFLRDRKDINNLSVHIVTKDKKSIQQAKDFIKNNLLTETVSNKIMQNKKQSDESEGKKYDSNKPMTGTVLRVFPQALNAIGACIRFGATKYPDPNNWKKNKEALVRYNDSLVRHLTKHFTGNELDEETGLPHLAHTAWNALAILELYLMEHPDKARELMYPKEIKQ